MLTANVDPAFDLAFPRTCARIGCNPIHLLGLMFSESGGSPSAHNEGPKMIRDKVTGELRASLPAERYNAVGLIQFMPDTLRGLGWTKGYEAFKHLSASQQLPYVAAFFEPWRKVGSPWDSAGRLYQACFLPATLATLRDPDSVLVAKGGRLGWAYEANAVFDANGDGMITISELSDAIVRNAKGARWDEMLARLGLGEAPAYAIDHDEELGEALALDESTLDAFLRTVRGTQAALSRLGYDLGPHGVDGFKGGDTTAAILRFQSEREISVDGIVGPETRAAIDHALIAAA